jgi:hypothetical protein
VDWDHPLMRDRSPIFLCMSDLLLCVLTVIICAVAATKAKTEGIKPKAEFLITADWPVSMDTDIDLWVVGPERKPVFYGSRQVGCADLDRDSLGYATSHVAFSDGTIGQEVSNKETISIRCLNPGHYDVAVNYFSNHSTADGTPVPVHLDLTGINPAVKTLYLKDVVLNFKGQTINVFSFDLSKDDSVQIVDPPLAPLTAEFGGGARP